MRHSGFQGKRRAGTTFQGYLLGGVISHVQLPPLSRQQVCWEDNPRPRSENKRNKRNVPYHMTTGIVAKGEFAKMLPIPFKKWYTCLSPFVVRVRAFISQKAYPRNWAPEGPTSMSLLARPSPSTMGGMVARRCLFTNRQVTRVGALHFLGGMIMRRPLCRQPHMAPPLASTMKLTRKLEEHKTFWPVNTFPPGSFQCWECRHQGYLYNSIFFFKLRCFCILCIILYILYFGHFCISFFNFLSYT